MAVVLTIIFKSHLGEEKGVGLVLNFTAAVIIIEFDELISKLFITLSERNQFEKFLVVDIKKGIFDNPRVKGVPLYLSAILKILAAAFSIGVLIYVVTLDVAFEEKAEFSNAVALDYEVVPYGLFDGSKGIAKFFQEEESQAATFDA